MKQQAKVTPVHSHVMFTDGAPLIVAYLMAGNWYTPVEVRAERSKRGFGRFDFALPYTRTAIDRRAAYGLPVPAWATIAEAG